MVTALVALTLSFVAGVYKQRLIARQRQLPLCAKYTTLRGRVPSQPRMSRIALVVCALCAGAAAVAAVKVKVVMHSDEDSKADEDERAEWRRADATLLPFIKTRAYEDAPTTAPPRSMHPNELIFPLIYRQSHINSMFKFGENWYTWSTEKRTDGSKATNYYICYDEPKRCDEIGWVRTRCYYTTAT